MPARDTAICEFGLVSCCVQWWFGFGDAAVGVARARGALTGGGTPQTCLFTCGRLWQVCLGVSSTSQPLIRVVSQRSGMVEELLMYDANVKRSGLGVVGRGFDAGLGGVSESWLTRARARPVEHPAPRA